jgi:hypothetical protein
MSLFVRRADGPPLLLVGDLTYDIHNPGLRILAAHDPAAAGLLEAA